MYSGEQAVDTGRSQGQREHRERLKKPESESPGCKRAIGATLQGPECASLASCREGFTNVEGITFNK